MWGGLHCGLEPQGKLEESGIELQGVNMGQKIYSFIKQVPGLILFCVNAS